MTWIAGLLAASAALIAALGLPLWLGKVPPNSLYGFRTPLTVAQPDMWYPINAISGRDLTLSGGLAAVLVLGADLLTLGPNELLLVGVWLAPILLGVVHSFWAASAYVGERIAEVEPPSEVSRKTSQAARRQQRKRESEP